MAEVVVGGNTFEISSKNKNWTCCDLKDGFLVLVNWDISEDDIIEEIEESQFTDIEHNTFFKSNCCMGSWIFGINYIRTTF